MTPVTRRTVLRGVGATVALPWLEAMGTVTAWAAPGSASPAKSPAPNRMCILYVPNGKNMADWTPKSEGKDFDLPHILQPLKGGKDDLLVLTGLTADKARAHGDGGGDHARALAAFLTGAQPRKPTAPTSAPASRSIRSRPLASATRPGSRPSKSAARPAAWRGTATPATRASTRRRCPGGPRRCRTRRK